MDQDRQGMTGQGKEWAFRRCTIPTHHIWFLFLFSYVRRSMTRCFTSLLV